MIKDCHPEIVVTDAQQLEKLDWNECTVMIKTGVYEIEVGVYRPDTKYFLRLWTYNFPDSLEKESWCDVFEYIFAKNKIEIAKCRKVQCIVDNPLFTVIPEALYDKKKQEDYFDFLFNKEDKQEVQTDEVKSESLRILYAVDKNKKEELFNKYPNISLLHNQTVLFNSLKGVERGAVVYITLDEKFISVIAFSAGKLQLAQSYKTETALDVVYHVLNVINNLNFSEEETTLFFTGKNKEADAILEKLKGRFNAVLWLNRPDGCQFPDEIDQYPSHYFYHLVSLALCEL